MLSKAALARVEEAYSAVNSLLKNLGKTRESHLARRAKKHLRAALCDLILCQGLPARPRRLLACKS